MYENNSTYTKAAKKIARLMKDAGGVTRAADLAENLISTC